MDIETRLAAARTRLILDKPFLGALTLRLPLEETGASWCKTTFSDGKSLYYSRQYIQALPVAELQFALAREALHCALLHFYRRGSRDPQLWREACNFAVNSILIHDGLSPPPDVHYLSEFDGMTAEEIYPLLQKNEDNRQQSEGSDSRESGEGQQDKKAGDGGHYSPPPTVNPGDMELLAAQWRQRLAAAAQQAMQAGKLSEEMARLVDIVLQPRLPWRSVLAQYLAATARNDYSYTRPSSRRGDPAIFPGMRSEEIDLVVAVDTSGSISDDEIGHFFTEINAIKGQIRARVVLLACDNRINEPFPMVYEPWESFDCEPEIRGGGGTDFRPVFDWISHQDTQPQALVYFTDACGSFPELEPQWPTLWLVKGKQSVPFGSRIQLNH